jgi:Leucine-rich repeat (LRR) protein
MDSRGASMAINSIKTKKAPQMSLNPHLVDLIKPCKELKAITLTMLSVNLKIIDVSDNKIESLPE